MQFHLLNTNDTQLKLLTSIPYNWRFYGLSPDGKIFTSGVPTSFLRITEVSSGRIVKTLDNTGVNKLHELREKGDIVSWSPDGTQFVFLKEISNVQGVKLILYDVLNDTQSALNDDESLYRSPVWSPDGKRIAAARMPSCGLSPGLCSPEENNWNIVVFDLDNHTSKQITHFDNIAGKFQDVWSKSLCNLDWSPDGNFIVFENSCSQFGPNSGKAIFVASVESKQTIQLTDFDYDDTQYIVRYSTKWLDSDNQLFVGYSITPIMPPSYELVPHYGYNIYQSANFNESAHSATFKEEQLYPEWSTFTSDETFVSLQDIENVACRQLLWGRYTNSEFVITTKENWPSLAPYSDILRSPDGNYLAYLTTGKECGDMLPAIILIDLNRDQVIKPATGLSGEINLLNWVEISNE